MAKITYSALRLEENEDGSFYVADLLLDGDEFYDDDTFELEDGTTVELVVDEDDWSKAQLIFNADDIDGAVKVALPDYAFDSGEVPEGASVTLSVDGEVVEPTVEVTIDTVAEDDIIDDQERADGVTITGTAAANAEVTLTFKVAVVPDVVDIDLTALEDELAAAEEALATVEEEAAQALADAEDETLNGVGDARDLLASAEDDLAASPKDADLKAAVDQAQADLDQAIQDAADAAAQVELDNADSIALAQADVDAAQAALEEASNASGVDLTALEEELAAAQEALTTTEEEAAQALADAEDEDQNGITDAKDAITSAEDDLAAAPNDADLKAALEEAQAALATLEQEVADTIAQITEENDANITAAQEAVDAAQAALDEAGNGETTYEEISTVTVTADEEGHWSYTLTDDEYAHTGEVIISVVAVDENGDEATAETTITIEKDETAPVIEITNFNEKTGVITGSIDDAEATIALTIGDSEREVTVDGDTWSYTLVDEDYQAAEFVNYEAEGTLAVSVVATDTAGNASEPVEDSLTVADKIAPEAPEFTTDPEDAIVAKFTTLFGSAEPNSKVILTFGEGGIQRTVYTDDAGQWERKVSKLDVLFLEDDDEQVITAVSYDAAGNKSEVSTFNPVPDVIALAPTVALETDSGESEFDAVTNDATLVVTDTEVGATVEFSVANVAGEPTTWSTTQPAAVQGENTILVRQIDTHGNESDTTEITFTFDNEVEKLDLNVAGNAAEGTTLNIAVAQDVVNFDVEPETGALVEYSLNGTVWTTTEPTHDLGLNEGFVRQTDIAGNVSVSAKYSFTAIPGPTPVAVTADGTTNAGTGAFAFNVAHNGETYNIAGFGHDDSIDFPAGQAPTVINNSFTDNAVDIQYAIGGKVTLLHLTGLSTADDKVIWGLDAFKALFGVNSVTNTGTGAVANTPSTPATPSTPTIEDTKTITGAGTTDIAAKVTELDFTAGTYTHIVTGFGAGDVLNFPNDRAPTVINNSFTDQSVDVQWTNGAGPVITVTLTGLANDNILFDATAFKGAFGDGSLI